MRIVVADQDRDLFSILPIILQQEFELEVVGQATTRTELFAQSRELSANVVLLDWRLIDSDAADVVSLLRALPSRPWVIVLDARPETRHGAMAAGADAFVYKGDGSEGLLAALRALSRGRSSAGL